MILAEPSGAPITQPENYWWWFLVTSSTVGYGDYYPVTLAGRLVGGYVVFGGISTITTLLAKLASLIEKARGRQMKGAITVDMSDHVVLLGYTPGRTERIVAELVADSQRPVVLAAWSEVESAPIPDIEFVRGDLTDDDVLRRAGVHRAHSVLIDARDDNEALAIAVTVNHLADTLIVVALRDLARIPHLRYVNEKARGVLWHHPRMLTEELQSPGISEVYTEMMTHGGRNTYSVRLTSPIAFGDCQLALGRRHDATVLAAHTGNDLLVSPPWGTQLPAGTVLYYVAGERLLPDQLTRALRGA